MKIDESLSIHISQVASNYEWYSNLLRYPLLNLENLPLVTPDLLDTHYYSNKEVSSEKDQMFFTSGTSSGIRKRVLWSQQDHDLYIEERARIFRSYVGNNCSTACVDLGTGHAANSGLEIFAKIGLTGFKIEHDKHVSEHVKMLQKINPDVIFTMPMILDKIIKAQGNQLGFSPKKIIVVGDIATPAWKRKILDYFSLSDGDLFDILGSIEVGSVAHEEPLKNRYVFDRNIIPELVSVGESEEVLTLTSLNRTSFPALRFFTNDLIEGFETITENNVTLYTFKKIKGRLGDETKHGEKIRLFDITEAINKHLPDAVFQVYKSTDEFVINIASANLTHNLSKKIITEILDKNPDIKEMVSSKIINNIEINKVETHMLPTGQHKHKILTLEKS